MRLSSAPIRWARRTNSTVAGQVQAGFKTVPQIAPQEVVKTPTRSWYDGPLDWFEKPRQDRFRDSENFAEWEREVTVAMSVGRGSARILKPQKRTLSPKRKRAFHWADYDDAHLLKMRICDLGLKIEGTETESRIERLYEELEARNLMFRPHFWLAEEWFCPDGVPGIAVPFYLAHPRLMRLEKKQMLEVEGGSEDWCLRILRHEAGHAIDNAYGLHRRRRWSQMFGRYTIPYPDAYQPKPYSKSFVLHLDPWYAQSHPAEDFAETFAVWLKPRSRWRTQYEGWPAVKKLEYVDELMAEINGKKPTITTRRQVDPVKSIRKTLGEHYAEKRKRYEVEFPNFYDRDLCRLFSSDPLDRSKPSAAAFLRRNREELCRMIAQWTGQYQYTVDQILGDIIERCRQLNLRLTRSERDARRNALVMITAQAMNYLHGGHHRFAL